MAQIVRSAGIDVSKDDLDVALWPRDGQGRRFARLAALPELVAWLRDHDVARVGLEASGGYEREIMAALRAAGFIVVLLNPLWVRRFAQARGRLAKNDRADAATIAQYTAVMVDKVRPGRDRELERLAEYLQVRRHVLDEGKGNLLEHLREPRLRQLVERRQAAARREVARLDRQLAALVAQRPDWSALARRLCSVPGVGPVLAHTLIALLPELGRASRHEIASLVGVAPFDDDSGRRSGVRQISGGREPVRNVLYMAAIVAKRWNPVIAACAERHAGKKPKVIIVACMRKLLVILNAIVRDGSQWNPDYAVADRRRHGVPTTCQAA